MNNSFVQAVFFGDCSDFFFRHLNIEWVICSIIFVAAIVLLYCSFLATDLNLDAFLVRPGVLCSRWRLFEEFIGFSKLLLLVIHYFV